MAPELPEDDRRRVLREALTATEAISDEDLARERVEGVGT